MVAFQMPENRGLSGKAWPYLAMLTDLQDLDLGGMNLNNDRIETISNLTELRSLNLFGNPIDSFAMPYLANLQKLETLHLYRTRVDDEGLESLARLKNLKRLNVLDTLLTDKGLKKLGNFKQLTHLSIGNSKAENFSESSFTPAGIKQLRLDLPNTEITYWGTDDEKRDLPEVLSDAADLDKANADERERRAKLEARNHQVTPMAIAAAPDLSTRQGADWPSFLGINGDGKSPEKGLETDWSANPPKLLWHKKIGTGYAAPTISNGRLMLYQRIRNEGGEQRFKERLSCLHSETGEEIWKVDFPTDYEDLNGYGDGPRSSPVIDGDRVFLLSPEGMLRCLQCVDGKLIWNVDLKADFDCDLLNFDPESGKMDFEFPWRSNIAGCVNAASPVVEEDRVLISESYSRGSAQLKLLDEGFDAPWQDSRKVREKSLLMHWATPIFHQGFVYGCSGRRSTSGELKCIDWKTGATVWKRKMPDRTSLTYFDQHFVNLGENGVLTLLNVTPDGYEEVGRLDRSNTKVMPSYPAWGAPVIARGLLYIRGKHELICYDISKAAVDAEK